MLTKIKDSIKKLFKILYRRRAYLALLIVLLFIIFAGYEYYSQYFDALKNPKKIKDLILSYGKYSVLAFIALQIIQVVAFFIPGEFIQISGGYIYGAFIGGFVTLIGITLGSSIVYMIARLCGKPFVNKIISKKNLNFFEKILKLGSANYIVFLLYLIPGIPKDVLAYICGITDIKFRDFIIYSTLGRIPGIFISTFFGSKMYAGNRGILITIAVTMTILFLTGLLKGEKIIKGLIKKQ